jgi:hypothetical protein
VRLGASVPVTSIFKEMLGIDTLMFGFNLPDEDVHAPNEFDWTLLLAELRSMRRSGGDMAGISAEVDGSALVLRLGPSPFALRPPLSNIPP